jgi:hypothetical protein
VKPSPLIQRYLDAGFGVKSDTGYYGYEIPAGVPETAYSAVDGLWVYFDPEKARPPSNRFVSREHTIRELLETGKAVYDPVHQRHFVLAFTPVNRVGEFYVG